MEKRNLFSLLFHIAVWFAICKVQKAAWVAPDDESGNISRQITSDFFKTESWLFSLEKFRYAVLQVKMVTLYDMPCSTNYFVIRSGSKEIQRSCYKNVTLDPVVVSGSSSSYVEFVYKSSRININYTINYQRGNVFPFVPRIEEFRRSVIAWLLNTRSTTFGWGEDTHRAIAALYLSGNATVQNDTWEGDVMIQRLELETAVALLRYSSNPTSLTDISMLINALILTCHNPRNFNSHNLLELLAERMNESTSLNPGAYLTLCIADRTLPTYETEKLFKGLEEISKYPIPLDNEALTVMALACAKKRGYDLSVFPNSDELYKASISRLITDRKPDGSYGNVYTSALVTQALLASGQEFNPSWVWNKTLMYLMNEINSTTDLLSISLALPLFNKKTLLDIASVNCTMPKDEYDISDIMERPGERMLVKFSLHIDVESGVIHTLYMKVPKTISAFEVLRVAQASDHNKYRFRYGNFTGNVYVYEIAGKTNDAQEQKYWIMYTENHQQDKTAIPISESLDKHAVNVGDHLIMVYKKVRVGANNVFPNLWSTLFPFTKDSPNTGNSSPTTSIFWTPMD